VPEVVGAKLLIVDGKYLKCMLPCDSSVKCDCFAGWDVTQLINNTKVCDQM